MFSHDALRRAQGSKRRCRKLLEGLSSWQLGLTLFSAHQHTQTRTARRTGTHTTCAAVHLKSDISREECGGDGRVSWRGGCGVRRGAVIRVESWSKEVRDN